MPHFEGVCDGCGNPFRAYRGPSSKGAPRFCSRACFLKVWEKANTYLCEHCGKQFDACITTVRPNPRFCSRVCHKAAVTSMVEVVCQHCGNVVLRNASHNRKYCSKSCAGKHATLVLKKLEGLSPVVRTCLLCHNTLGRRQNRSGRKFCSKKCWYAWSAQHAIRRVKTPEENTNYRGPNWTAQRRNARHRDDYTCQRCGMTEALNGAQLQVHHIIPFASFGIDNFKAANALENLVSLCLSCHGIVEQGGWPRLMVE